MLVYIIAATILFLGVILRQGTAFYWTGYAFLFIITVFRDPVLGATDTIIYQDFFHSIPPISDIMDYDSKYTLGYTLLSSLVKQFSDEFVDFQFVYGVITFYLLNKILQKLALNYHERCFFLLSYFAFRFIWNQWIILRQNIAELFFWLILIELYSILKETNGDTRKDSGIHLYNRAKIVALLVLSILVPALFHTSAFFNIPLLMGMFLFHKMKPKYVFGLTVVLSILCMIGSQSLFSTLFGWASSFDTRYEMYETNADSGQNILNTLFKFIFFMVFVLHYNKEWYPKKRFVLDTMAVTCILSSINVEIMIRMYEYYAIGFYTLMAIFLHNFSNHRIVVAMVVSSVLLIILIRFLFIFDGGSFINYSFWPTVF